MVAKINRGSSLYGALVYNQEKVDRGTARIISGNRMITNCSGDPEKVLPQTLLSFENYLLANRNTEKPVLHISLNPSPEDRLTDGQFASLARDYMERMGYGDQPYVVYKHEDIDRRHIHIVSVCVDENGRKLPDSYEWKRSMDACRELETKYSLKQVTDKRNEQDAPYLKKVAYERGDVKRQVSNALKSLATTYKYQSFGEYNALLSCFHIEAKLVKGEYNGQPYNGVVYSVTDDKGNVLGTPFKSSLFGKEFGYEGLNKRMERCSVDFKDGKFFPVIHADIAHAMRTARDKHDFVERLRAKGIDTVFRVNESGRIYGVTFVDHARKEVYNGSRLGKEFSANVFQRMFNGPSAGSRLDNQTDKVMPGQDSPRGGLFLEYLPGSETSIEQAFGIFPLEQHGRDYEEEAFARRMRRKKKKRLGRSL